VPVVFKTMALGASLREGQHRVQPIQRLNGSFLIDAVNSRMLRGIQIEPENVRGFGLELRIIAGHVPFKAVRLQSGLFPYAMDSVLAEPRVEASLRQLQWVAPSFGLIRVAERILACSVGVTPEPVCPG
jgi:hypothetical protein